MMKLEATEARKAVYSECVKRDEHCTGCPFMYSCEEHFPYMPRVARDNDLIPADYVLTEDGTAFVWMEV